MNRARQGEERGKGTPLMDIQRVAKHYNIDEATAAYWLTIHTIHELIPERGYGLTHAHPDILTGTSMSELSTALDLMEDSLNEGEMAKLELATYELPGQDDLDVMWAEMVKASFHVSRPTPRIVDGIPLTSMVLTKGSPQWAALIPLLVPIGIIGLITFGIVKIETISKALLPIILAAGGLVVLALGIMRKPAAAAAERYIERKL